MQIGVDIGSYVFDASAKTITFSGVTVTDIEQIKPIINGTRNIDIFNPLTAGKFGTLVGQVLTLDFDTTSQADTDKLYICVNLADVALATEANQTNGNQKTKITDGAGTVNTKQLGVQLTNADVGLVTNTVIHGLTTGGGGGYVDVKVTPSGALTVEINDGGGSITVDGTVEITNDAGNPIPISAASLPLPTGASTLTEQQSQTLQLNELVSLFSSKLRDAAGRIRVSQPTSLGDYKILNNTFDALQLQQVGTGTFTQNQNSTTMAVTSGQYAIIQTKQYHPYLNQKSQDWTMTFTGMGSAANVEKSIGYISSNAVAPFNSTLDGMRIFKDASNDYFLQIWRNGALTINIARSAWTDKLDGTGASGMNINWDNFNVMGADFLYLGGTAVAFKIMHGRTPVIFHIHAYSNTDTQPIFNSPNKPLRWEIRSTTGTGSMNMVCGNVNTEGELKGLGNTITIKGNTAGITAAAVGTAYALCGVRKKVAQRDVAAMVDMFEGMASTNDFFEVALILNPTIAGVVTWADVANTPFQSFVGVATNVVTGGTLVGNTYASQNMNNARAVENILTRLNSTITDTMDVLALCVIPSLGSTNVTATGSMQCRWIT